MKPELTFDDRDDFHRKKTAENLIKLIMSDIDLSPVVINGDWGIGKTEFCIKTVNEIKNKNLGYNCVYIDAFSADNSDEPTLTLLASIISLLPKNKKEELRKKAIPVIKYLTKVILNAGTNVILKENIDKLSDEFSDAIKEQTTTVIDTTIDNLLETHEESNNSIIALKSILEDISSKSPLIIFIDELDRCRPNYAIKMIESIKHIFNVKNVKFVLIANIKQLSSSINKIYGESIDADKYLNKFIGFKLDLHTYNINNSSNNSTSYLKILLNEHNSELKSINEETFIEIMSFLIKKNNNSLRDVGNLVKYIRISQMFNLEISRNDLMHSILRLLGIYIYAINSKLKNSILTQNYTCEEVIKTFPFILEKDNTKDYTSSLNIMIILLIKSSSNYSEYIINNNILKTSVESIYPDKTDAKYDFTIPGSKPYDFVNQALHTVMLI
ncbi:KAP family P-loop NTPase fold protein [Proteus genomosp. 4]|uniref:KAP family P-loop NTPase fold protein n=1 Tax=Proteus genomosp. 4 TaxID=1311818 RepID=UPI000D6914DC|nr:P-loop NTPase fold protein [Proteus genomosp. 4]